MTASLLYEMNGILENLSAGQEKLRSSCPVLSDPAGVATSLGVVQLRLILLNICVKHVKVSIYWLTRTFHVLYDYYYYEHTQTLYLLLLVIIYIVFIILTGNRV